MSRYTVSPVLNAIYRHLASGRLYRVKGIARPITAPRYPTVVYEQLYDGELKGVGDTGEVKLPRGTLWTREVNDFNEKFMQVDPRCSMVRTLIKEE